MQTSSSKSNESQVSIPFLSDRYFLSCLVEVEPVQIDANNQSIGIDLGIKTFAVMSDGTTAESPNYSTLDRKIGKLQKKLARQSQDSKRRNKTRTRIAKLHSKIANTRQDFLHKWATTGGLPRQN